MAYSNSKKAIRKVQHYLEAMAASETDLSFIAEDPVKEVYNIRTGIKASKVHAKEAEQAKQDTEPFETFSKLGTKFIIRSMPGKIVCELRDPPIVLGRIKTSLSTISIPDVRDVLGIIGATVKHASANQLTFPAANATTIDAAKLTAWAQTKGYSVTITDAHVTLTKPERGAEDST